MCFMYQQNVTLFLCHGPNLKTFPLPPYYFNGECQSIVRCKKFDEILPHSDPSCLSKWRPTVKPAAVCVAETWITACGVYLSTSFLRILLLLWTNKCVLPAMLLRTGSGGRKKDKKDSVRRVRVDNLSRLSAWFAFSIHSPPCSVNNANCNANAINYY